MASPNPSAYIHISLYPRQYAAGRFGTECLLCGRLVTIGEDTDCPHYRGLDAGFPDTRMEFEAH